MAAEDLVLTELMLNRFHKLVGELMRGSVARNTFLTWEVEILLDVENCQVLPKKRIEILRRYQKAVEKQMDTGPGPPMKLSEFLQLKSTRRPTILK